MISADTPLEHRTVSHVLHRQADRQPDKVALRDEVRSVTYADALTGSFSFANGLTQLGLGPQETIAVMLDNHLDFVATWLGISVSPYVEVPINTAYKGLMLEHVIGHSEARVVIIEDAYCDRLAAVIDNLPAVEIVVVRGGDGAALPARMRRASFEEVCEARAVRGPEPAVSDTTAVLYTSGTTGRSKGVVIPHGHAFCGASAWPLTSAHDVTLVTLPLFHTGGKWASTYNTLIAGGTAVIVPRFSATKFWQQVDQFQCTNTLLVGGTAEFLWQQPARADDLQHTLEKVCIVPSYGRVHEFCSRFGVEASTVYGSTELGSVMAAKVGEHGTETCGLPRPDIQARVVDANDVEVKHGEYGELVVRPTEPWSIMNGYYKTPDKTVEAWRNFWFHTGDIVRQDSAGLFYFGDRMVDALRRRGENVTSFEVEEHLMVRPEIAQVAAIGIRTEHAEDEILVALVLHPGAHLDPAELIEDLAGRMPYFMVPRYVDIVEELPMTPTQKVQKAELRARGVSETAWDREDAGIRVTWQGEVRRRVLEGGEAADPVSRVSG